MVLSFVLALEQPPLPSLLPPPPKQETPTPLRPTLRAVARAFPEPQNWPTPPYKYYAKVSQTNGLIAAAVHLGIQACLPFTCPTTFAETRGGRGEALRRSVYCVCG